MRDGDGDMERYWDIEIERQSMKRWKDG
jgi:hypothetical protein